MSAPRLHDMDVIRQSKGGGGSLDLTRIRVAGGWLYILQINSVVGIAATMEFVPDQAGQPDLAAEIARGTA